MHRDWLLAINAAMELYLSRDRDTVHEIWNDRVRPLLRDLQGIAGQRVEQPMAVDEDAEGRC